MPPCVHQTAVFLLAGVLVTSALAKAVSPSRLHDALYASGLVPLPLAMPAAVAVTWLEMFIGLMLLASIRVGAWRPHSLQATLEPQGQLLRQRARRELLRIAQA